MGNNCLFINDNGCWIYEDSKTVSWADSRMRERPIIIHTKRGKINESSLSNSRKQRGPVLAKPFFSSFCSQKTLTENWFCRRRPKQRKVRSALFIIKRINLQKMDFVFCCSIFVEDKPQFSTGAAIINNRKEKLVDEIKRCCERHFSLGMAAKNSLGTMESDKHKVGMKLR